MCSEVGVKLLYLPPYSPDQNPIEEFFSELKSRIIGPVNIVNIAKLPCQSVCR